MAAFEPLGGVTGKEGHETPNGTGLAQKMSGPACSGTAKLERWGTCGGI